MRPVSSSHIRWQRIAQLVLAFAFLMGGTLPAFANETVHVVKPGETLSQIAEAYGTTVNVLRSLNNLGDVDFVWYGQQLIVESDETPLPRESTVVQTIAYYQVQPGDTLTGIANAYGIGLAHLVELNRISPAGRLYSGQTLAVPARDIGAPRSDVELSNLPVHIVQAGEHVGIIAGLYGISVDALVRTNGLADPSLIVPGQKLRIPPVTAESVEPAAPAYHHHTTFPTTTEKWIDVDLSEQRVVAYEGTTQVNAFIISSGLPGTPTVTGTFRIWAKVPVQDMYGGNRAAGNYYYLEDVPWVQYFYADYAFHGTTWHANFGRPASRGCINMSPADAEWLFDWAAPEAPDAGWLFSDGDNPGTLVVVHE
ncbi:MAG: LysM peptidoglycan-binding domain-containing protein [Caldilineaceae bacterium]|nr:LysM peptidoglycan-binding domain-containing protein [Caldilineaceae bacterium]